MTEENTEKAPEDPYSAMAKRMVQNLNQYALKQQEQRRRERWTFMLSVAVVAPTVGAFAGWIHVGTQTAVLYGGGYGLLVALLTTALCVEAATS